MNSNARLNLLSVFLVLVLASFMGCQSSQDVIEEPVPNVENPLMTPEAPSSEGNIVPPEEPVPVVEPELPAEPEVPGEEPAITDINKDKITRVTIYDAIKIPWLAQIQSTPLTVSKEPVIAPFVGSIIGSVTQPGTVVTENEISLKTDSGLLLHFDKAKNYFDELKIGEQKFQFSDGEPLKRIGLSVYDPTGPILLDKSSEPAAEYNQLTGKLTLTRSNSGVETKEIWKAYPEHIELEMEVVDISGSPERSFEACMEIPVDLVGMKWHGQLHESESIEANKHYKTIMVKLIDIGGYGDGSQHMKTDLDLNLNGINVVANDSTGIAVAIDPNKPAAYYTSYDSYKKSLNTCFHIGVVNGNIGSPSKADFAMAIFTPDNPEYGLRSGLDKLAKKIYPSSFIGNLERQTEMVKDAAYNYSIYPEPSEFSIGAAWGDNVKEGIDKGVYNTVYTWPLGFIDRGMKLKTTEADKPLNKINYIDQDVEICMDIYKDLRDKQNHFPETCTLLPYQECGPTPNFKGLKDYGPTRRACSGDNCTEAYEYVNIQPATIMNVRAPLFLHGEFNIYDPFNNSILRNPEGTYHNAVSYATPLSYIPWFKSYTCMINGFNPDPGINYLPSNKPVIPPPSNLANFGQLNLEILKRAIGLYGEFYVGKASNNRSIYFNGAAIDTIGAYMLQDFNPLMLNESTYPLAYDKTSSSPVSLTHLQSQAFLEAVKKSLPAGRAIAINGYPNSGLLTQQSDFFIAETGTKNISNTIPAFEYYYNITGPEDYQKYKAVNKYGIEYYEYDEIYNEEKLLPLRWINRYKMGAFQRPISFFARFDAKDDTELIEHFNKILPLYTATGTYLYANKSRRDDPATANVDETVYFFAVKHSPAVLERYKKHTSFVHELITKGWEPVPFAKTANKMILIERYGVKYLTVYNMGKETSFPITIDWQSMGLGKAPIINDVETGKPIMTTDLGNGLIRVNIANLASLNVMILAMN